MPIVIDNGKDLCFFCKEEKLDGVCVNKDCKDSPYYVETEENKEQNKTPAEKFKDFLKNGKYNI